MGSAAERARQAGIRPVTGRQAGRRHTRARAQKQTKCRNSGDAVYSLAGGAHEKVHEQLVEDAGIQLTLVVGLVLRGAVQAGGMADGSIGESRGTAGSNGGRSSSSSASGTEALPATSGKLSSSCSNNSDGDSDNSSSLPLACLHGHALQHPQAQESQCSCIRGCLDELSRPLCRHGRKQVWQAV